MLRFSALKRLYRLMTQYLADVLQKPTSNIDVPDLQSIAKQHNHSALLTLCRMAIVIGVQCEKNREFIDKIQSLSQSDQHHLMRAIEQVRWQSLFLRTARTDNVGNGGSLGYHEN